MKNRFCLGALILLLLAPPSWGKETAAAGEAPIYNVLDLAMQQCEGPVATLLNVHPQRDQVLRSGVLPLADLDYQVDLKRIPDFREWTVATRLHDRSRQVDDSYVLFTRTGLATFEAAYVITRLPDSTADTGHALQVVAQMQKKAAAGGKTSFIEAVTPFGRGLEMVVGGRTGSACFPTSPFRYAELGQPASIGISRFVVRNGHLIEYTMVLPWPEGASQAQAVERAQSRMNAFERGLKAMERDESADAQP